MRSLWKWPILCRIYAFWNHLRPPRPPEFPDRNGWTWGFDLHGWRVRACNWAGRSEEVHVLVNGPLTLPTRDQEPFALYYVVEEYITGRFVPRGRFAPGATIRPAGSEGVGAGTGVASPGRVRIESEGHGSRTRVLMPDGTPIPYVTAVEWSISPRSLGVAKITVAAVAASVVVRPDAVQTEVASVAPVRAPDQPTEEASACP